MNKIRVGLAGAGWVMSARHVPSLQQRSAELDIVAVYDRRPERARALAERLGGGVTVCSSLDDFVGVGLDMVSIATSPWSHREIAVAALRSGAHVFTEKPMAMNSAEATDMVAAARAADRLLCVSHNFLYSRSVKEADRRLAGNPVDYAMGLQLSSEARRLPTWYKDLPGGLMFDEIPHMLYCMNHYLGGDLRLDHARGTFADDGHPRTVELLLRGRTGPGQVTMVFCAPVSEWHLMLSSRQRAVGLDLFRDIAVGVGPDGAHSAADIARTSAAVLSGHLTGFARSGARLVGGRQFWGHEVILSRFVDAVLGRMPSPVRLEDSSNVVAVTDEVLAELELTLPTRG